MRENEDDSQADQTGLKALLQEYPLLPLCPVNVVLKHSYLRRLAIGNRVEEIEECPDCASLKLQSEFQSSMARTELRRLRLCSGRHERAGECDDLCDTIRIPSQQRSATLKPCNWFKHPLLVPIQLAQLHKRSLLVAERMLIPLVLRARLGQDLLVQGFRLLGVRCRDGLRFL